MGKNRTVKIAIATILVAGSIVTTVIAGGTSTGEPGSIDDPVVTKSYVDEQVRLEVEKQMKQLTPSAEAGGIAPVVVEAITSGDIIIAKAGTEMIVRTGNVVAYGDGSNGIPDATGATDVKIGSTIGHNHLLIFPRDDGRGIKVVSGTAYVMIRGEYEKISK